MTERTINAIRSASNVNNGIPNINEVTLNPIIKKRILLIKLLY